MNIEMTGKMKINLMIDESSSGKTLHGLKHNLSAQLVKCLNFTMKI